ncbi:unnamed protein product, partial [Owenia fusiformis]
HNGSCPRENNSLKQKMYHITLALLLACVAAKPLVKRELDDTLGWRPQYGTAKYPKYVGQWPNVNQGDIYCKETTDDCYLAKCTGDLEKKKGFANFPDIEDDNWLKLQKGTFLYPKNLCSKDKLVIGDIFIDDSGGYYEAQTNGSNNDYILTRNKWKQIHPETEWMSLLRPMIGDRRIGDIVIPGSHDAGTWGITAESELINNNPLFELADQIVPDVVANWSINQDQNFTMQLRSGLRYFDMRIAAVDNGIYRWWHGKAGTEVEPGLQEIADFARDNRNEILLLEFGHFAQRGIAGTDPIPENRKDEISDMMLRILSPHLVDSTAVDSNPTINAVLATGKNIIAMVKDDYIVEKSDLFWDFSIVHHWTGVSNPEDLFEQRTGLMREYRQNNPNDITGISACVTPNTNIVIGGALRHSELEPIFREVLELIFGDSVVGVQPSDMSFEGLQKSTIELGNNANVLGMNGRDPERYTRVGSVHHRGLNEQFENWLARPGIYKNNIIYIDSFQSSTLVQTAIKGNLGEIPRQVTIANQGNLRDGYLRWEGFRALDGDEGHICDTTTTSYSIVSLTSGTLKDAVPIPSQTSLNLREGEFPIDSDIVISVTGAGANDWFELYRANINTMVLETRDLFIRGTDLGDGAGFAYIDDNYDTFGEDCVTEPIGVVNIVRW